jgi:hypothetical protein
MANAITNFTQVWPQFLGTSVAKLLKKLICVGQGAYIVSLATVVSHSVNQTATLEIYEANKLRHSKFGHLSCIHAMRRISLFVSCIYMNSFFLLCNSFFNVPLRYYILSKLLEGPSLSVQL